MEIDRISHINFVTKDLKKISAAFEELTGKKPFFNNDHTSTDGVKEDVFIFPHGFQVQEITDAGKPLGGLLKDMEEGVHTFTMISRDIDQCIPEMESMGFKLLFDNTDGKRGLRQATFDTTSAFGFYIELMEYVDPYDYGYDGTDVIE